MDRWNWPLGAGGWGWSGGADHTVPPWHHPHTQNNTRAVISHCVRHLSPSCTTASVEGAGGQNTTMACPYNVSSRDEQRSGFVTNRCGLRQCWRGSVTREDLVCGFTNGEGGGCVISGVVREVPENCVLLGHYAASSDSYRCFEATYRSQLRGSHWRPTRPETSVRNYHYTLRKSSEECSSQDK